MTASLTKTRTRTRREGTQILRQGGTLSHLVGNPTRDLGPVPRRKANKNKRWGAPRDGEGQCAGCNHL